MTLEDLLYSTANLVTPELYDEPLSAILSELGGQGKVKTTSTNYVTSYRGMKSKKATRGH